MYNFKFGVSETLTAFQSKASAGFDSMRRAANTFSGVTKTLPRSIQQIEEEMRRLRTAQSTALSVADVRRYGAEINKLDRQLANLRGTPTNIGIKGGGGIGNIGGMASKLPGLLAGAFAVDRIVSFGSAVSDTLAEFQKYEVVLTNTLGSNSAANRVMSDITTFAAKTPFAVDELTASFVKLANQGFVPNQREMTLLGDLASANGKSFEQMTEALLDAQVGEFERLKEFGIKASKQGDSVKLSWKGVVKEVKNTPDAIRGALLEFGKLKGVEGGMAGIAKTVGGMKSNFIDGFQQMQLKLGEAFAPGIMKVYEIGIKAVSFFTNLIDSNKGNITDFMSGVWKTGEVVWEMAKRIWVAMEPLRDLVSYIFQKISTNSGTLQKVGTVLFNIFTGLVYVFSKLFVWAWKLQEGMLTVFYKIYSTLFKFTSFVFNLFTGLASWIWEHSPFKALYDTLSAVFPGIKKFIQDIKDWFYDQLIKPVTEWFNGILGYFTKPLTFNTKVVTGAGDNKTEGAVDKTTNDSFYEDLKKKMNFSGETLGGSSGSGKGKGEAASVSGSGRPAIVNVNVGSLIENFNLAAMKIEQSEAQLKETLTRVLLSVLNDARQSL
jgi:hypothetical protein